MGSESDVVELHTIDSEVINIDNAVTIGEKSYTNILYGKSPTNVPAEDLDDLVTKNTPAEIAKRYPMPKPIRYVPRDNKFFELYKNSATSLDGRDKSTLHNVLTQMAAGQIEFTDLEDDSVGECLIARKYFHKYVHRISAAKWRGYRLEEQQLNKRTILRWRPKLKYFIYNPGCQGNTLLTSFESGGVTAL